MHLYKFTSILSQNIKSHAFGTDGFTPDKNSTSFFHGCEQKNFCPSNFISNKK